MVLAVKSWQLREEARRAIAAGDFEEALDCVLDAQELQRTELGESLRVLCAALVESEIRS
jgi:hypothetical protein